MLAVIAGPPCFLAVVYIATHASHIDAQAFNG